MDWDGVGTFALFMASGAVGVGMIMLRAYKAKLEARLEEKRIQRLDGAPDEVVLDHIRSLETQVKRLSERVEFSERLLEKGSHRAEETATSEAD